MATPYPTNTINADDTWQANNGEPDSAGDTDNPSDWSSQTVPGSEETVAFYTTDDVIDGDGNTFYEVYSNGLNEFEGALSVTGLFEKGILIGGEYVVGTAFGVTVEGGTLTADSVFNTTVHSGTVEAPNIVSINNNGGSVSATEITQDQAGDSISIGQTSGSLTAGSLALTASGSIALSPKLTEAKADQFSIDGGSATISGAASATGIGAAVSNFGGVLTFDHDLSLSNGVVLYADGDQTSVADDLFLSGKDDDTVTVNVESGGLTIGGTASAGENNLDVLNGGALSGESLVTGYVTGQIAVAAGTTTPTYSLNIDNQGKIEADDGTLILDGNASGDGQYLVGDDSTLEFGGKVDDDVTIMFLPGDDETITIDDPVDFKGVISSENFEPGDKIDLPNVPYVSPGATDTNPDGASFYFETGQGQSNYVLQVVEDDQTYDVPISEDGDESALNGGFTLSDDGHGGTLVTYVDDAVTGYSVTASADTVQSYDGVVKIIALAPVKTNSVVGSGFAVAGGPSDLILTEGHVVYQKDATFRVYLPNGDYKIGYVVASGSPLYKIPIPFFGDHFEPRENDWAYLEVPGLNFTSSQQFQI